MIFSKASELFDFIMYADDTTLMSVLNAFGINKDMQLNDELHKVSEWLLVNRLSINTDKTKCMIFHQYNKIIEIPNVTINNVEIECVRNFNLLGININKNLNWKHHTDKIANKISKTICILHKLKRILPTEIKLIIYNSLILPQINYGILAWGYHSERLSKLQKKAVRHITDSKYNAHTNPLFKNLKTLKIEDIFKLTQMKFYHKYLNNKLPVYLQNMPFIYISAIHDHNMRQKDNIYTNLVKHSFAKKLPSLQYTSFNK